MCLMCRSVPSACKHPWVLEIHGQKNWGGHLHEETICMYDAYIHVGSPKVGGGHLHEDERLLYTYVEIFMVN